MSEPIVNEEVVEALQEAAQQANEKSGVPSNVEIDENLQKTLNKQEAVDIDEGIEQAVKDFDVTRDAREEAMARAKKVLDRASKGAKLDRKDVAQALSGLYLTTAMQDEIIVSLIGDIMRTIKALAVSEGNIMQQGIQITTLARTLQKMEVVTEEKMQEVYKEEILPQLRQQMPQTPTHEAAGVDLTEKYEIPTTEEDSE